MGLCGSSKMKCCNCKRNAATHYSIIYAENNFSIVECGCTQITCKNCGEKNLVDIYYNYKTKTQCCLDCEHAIEKKQCSHREKALKSNIDNLKSNLNDELKKYKIRTKNKIEKYRDIKIFVSHYKKLYCSQQYKYSIKTHYLACDKCLKNENLAKYFYNYSKYGLPIIA